MSGYCMCWTWSRKLRLESPLKNRSGGGTHLMGVRTFGQNSPLQIMPGWTICIHVYNSAGVAFGTLDHASKEAAEIFRAVGVPTLWHIALPDSTEVQTTRANADERNCIVLCVARGTPRTVFPGALGFALPHTRSGSGVVTIFYDRIERLERRRSLWRRNGATNSGICHSARDRTRAPRLYGIRLEAS